MVVVVVVVAITRTLPVCTCTLLFFSPSVVNAVWVIVVLPHTLTHTHWHTFPTLADI